MQARTDALALMQEALRLLDSSSGGGIAVCTLQLAVDQLGVQVGLDEQLRAPRDAGAKL